MLLFFLPWLNNEIVNPVKGTYRQEGVISKYGSYLALAGGLFGYAMSKKYKKSSIA